MRTSERPAEAPPLSAVCFSSRWIHPSNAKDPWDTFAVAKAFHATDFVWTYSLDRKAVGRHQALGTLSVGAEDSLGAAVLMVMSEDMDVVGNQGG